MALCMLVTVPAAADSLMIKRKFPAGAKRYLENKVELTQKIMGGPMGEMTVKVKQLYGIWEEIKNSSPQKSTVSLTFDRVSRAMDMQMFATQFDTDDPEFEEADPQLKVILNNMVGESMTMEVDGAGQLAAFSGMDDIRKKIAEKAVMNMQWSQMEHEFNDEIAGNRWGRESLQVFPNKPVSVGDSWTGTTESPHPMLGTMVTESTYTLTDIKTDNNRKIAVISTKATTTRKPAEGEDAATAPSLTGSSSGVSTYDVEAGLVTGSEINGTMLVEFLPPGAAEGSPKVKADLVISGGFKSMSVEQRMAQKKVAQELTEKRRRAAEAEEAEDEDDDDEDDEDEEEEEEDDA
jgi:hypothetical protein